ncbi:MAG: type II secretion system protein GspC [Steroidobacteraceae bacterium]
MQLPLSLNERFGRIAAVAQGARADGWQKLLPLAVAALLVVLLAWQLVQLTWALLGAKTGVATTTNAPAVVGPPPARAVDVGAIVNAHLFGEANAPAAGSTDPNAVAASQMPLVLVGTIANTDPTLGYAIIGESAVAAKVYGVGKTITGGTKLHSVYPDRAILDRGGKLEALLLPKKFQGGGLSAGPQAGANPDDPLLGERLRQLAANNPAAITDILRPQPVFANGQQRGYRIYPGRNRSQFNRLGLLPGDLVTAINGTPLDDASRGMDILQTMNTASAVTMTVERNGETVQVNVNNAQIAADAAAAAAQPEAIPVNEVPGQPGDSAE